MCEKNGMDVLFRVSLAILKIGEEDLLSCQSLSSVYSVLESLPTRMWDADKLLRVGQVLLVMYIADAFLQVEAELRPILLHDDIVKRRAIHVEALSQRT
jgi:small G protein signaling modulator 3